jgi:hypothetical protein
MDTIFPATFKIVPDTQSLAKDMLDWMYQCYVEAMSIPLRSVENVDSERFCRAMAFGGRLEETATPAEDATPANDYMMGFQALFSKFESLAAKAHYHPSFLQSHSKQGCRNTIYESKFAELSVGRKFCVTKKRHLAWVPLDTRPTDRICFLAGCGVPFVVRPVDQHYELVGDCYRDDMGEEKSLLISQVPHLFEFL